MNAIAAGDYEIDFSAQLPSQLPSTFFFKEKSKRVPNIKLGYYAQVTVLCRNKEYNLTHRKVLIIREKPETLVTMKKLSDEAKFKTWGCCNQGNSKLDSVFDKNVFKPKETAEVKVNIDNSKCNLKVKRVRYFLEQRMQQTIRTYETFNNVTLNEMNIVQSCDGPNANSKIWQKTMHITLNQNNMGYITAKKQKGKQITKEE